MKGKNALAALFDWAWKNFPKLWHCSYSYISSAGRQYNLSFFVFQLTICLDLLSNFPTKHLDNESEFFTWVFCLLFAGVLVDGYAAADNFIYSEYYYLLFIAIFAAAGPKTNRKTTPQYCAMRILRVHYICWSFFLFWYFLSST